MEDQCHRLLANARIAEELTYSLRQRSPLRLVEPAYRHVDARELCRGYLVAPMHKDCFRFDEYDRDGVHWLPCLARGDADLLRDAAAAVLV